MKKLFHKGYFWEMFRQLRVVGIVSASVLMLTNVTYFFTLLTNVFTDLSTSYSIPGAIELAAPMMTFVYIAGLVFTFVAYNWLNRRSYSDFYHGLPVTRKQIYFSSFLAIMFWMVFGIAAYAAVHALIYLFFGAAFNYLLFLCVIVNMIIGAIEVVGAVSIACAISGTRFVNLFASIVIMFIPRFLLTVLAVFVWDEAPYMLKVTNLGSPLFDPSYNIFGTPYALILSSIFGSSFSVVSFTKPLAMLWSFLYSTGLVIVGAVAFNKRSSETAGIPTKSKLFQAVVRTAIGLPFLLILVFFLARGELSIVGIVILLLVSFTLYCLYELISTRRPKKMLKAMPLFTICMGISLLYLLIPKLVILIEENKNITKENIAGYSDGSEEYSYSILSALFDVNGAETTYSDIKTGKMVFGDAESVEIIARAYERTQQMVKMAKNGYDENYNYVTVTVVRKLGGKVTRNLLFTNGELERLGELKRLSDKYSKLVYEYPQGTRFYYCSYLTQIEAREVGMIFEEEFKTLTEEQKDRIRYKGMYGGYAGIDYVLVGYTTTSGRSSLMLSIYGCIGPDNYKNIYKISSDTPRTAAKMIEYLNKRSGEAGRQALEKLKAWFENSNSEMQFSLSIGNDASIGNYSTRYWMNMWSQENGNEGSNAMLTDPEYYEVVKILAGAPLATEIDEGALIRIEIDYEMNRFFVKLSEEDYQRIVELCSKAFEKEPDYVDYYDDYVYDGE